MKLCDQYDNETVSFIHEFFKCNLPRSFLNALKHNRDVPADRQTRKSNMIQIDRCDSNFENICLYTQCLNYEIYGIKDLNKIYLKPAKKNSLKLITLLSQELSSVQKPTVK